MAVHICCSCWERDESDGEGMLLTDVWPNADECCPGQLF